MNLFKNCFASSIFYLSACTQVSADIPVALSVDSVQTKRAKNVLVRTIQYNTEKSALRLESIKPIEHTLLDSIDITSFSVESRKYEFSKCDELAVNSVVVDQDKVTAIFECFVPKATAVVATCTIPINDNKFGVLACTKHNE